MLIYKNCKLAKLEKGLKITSRNASKVNWCRLTPAPSFKQIVQKLRKRTLSDKL